MHENQTFTAYWLANSWCFKYKKYKKLNNSLSNTQWYNSQAKQNLLKPFLYLVWYNMYSKYIVRTILTWAGDLSLSQGFFALQASLFMGQLCNQVLIKYNLQENETRLIVEWNCYISWLRIVVLQLLKKNAVWLQNHCQIHAD